MAQVLDDPVGASAKTPLRVVLFGMPESGKSSLLAALTKAFGPALVDRSGELGKASREVAEPREEVITYPAEVVGNDVVFIDCDGHAAMRILRQEAGPDSKLAQEIRQADALLLAVDASESDEKLAQQFSQFADFLHVLEESRGTQSEIAGLPVYLVLTKCDKLAEKTDSLGDWREKVTKRQKKMERAFEAFLAKRKAEGAPGFGSIHLDVRTTNVRQPALDEVGAKCAGSVGVAELFESAVAAAADYSERTQSAASRLRVTVFATLGLLCVMLVGALVVYAMRPGPEVAALENSIRTMLPRSASPTERLKDADKRLEDLEAMLKNPHFPALPPKTKEDVQEYQKELQAFVKYNKDFLDQVRDPRLARTEAELDKIEDALKRFPIPQSYAADWSGTIAGRRLQQYHIDVRTLRQEVATVEKELQALDKKREALGSVAVKDYPQKRKELIAEAEKQHLFLQERNKRIPGSNITYDQVLHFDRVLPWFRKWEQFRKGPVIGS